MRASLKWPAVALAVLTLVGFGPVISVSIAKMLAKWFGCAIDESGVHTCPAHGHDVGGMLSAMFGAGSFQQTTSPVAAIAVVGWVMLLLAVLFRTAKR